MAANTTDDDPTSAFLSGDLNELSLEQLQQQFETIQQESLSSSSSYKLNDHNIIELIQYIKKNDQAFADQLCFTTDGKEYITKDQIEYELQILLEKYGGRINKNELPKLLRVDFTYLESPILNLINKQLILPDLINGCEILTSSYLESVVMEINELLVLYGYIYIGTLTKQLFLPSDFIKEHIITKYKHLLLNGTIFSNNSLYTEKYINNLKSITIGICNGIISRSIDCNELLKITKQFYIMMNDSSMIMTNESSNDTQFNVEIELELFQTIIKDLIKNKQLNGTLQVNSTLYVPNVYEKNATDQICQFIDNNGYISIERVEQLIGYKAFKSTQQMINYLNAYRDSLTTPLTTTTTGTGSTGTNSIASTTTTANEMIIHMKLIESLRSIFDSTLNGNNDKHKSIPLHIENNGGDHCVLMDTSCDMKQLIDKYIVLNKNIKSIIVFDNRYVMSLDMIDQLLNDQFKPLALEQVSIYLKTMSSETTSSPNSSSTSSSTQPQPSSKKSKQKKSNKTSSSSTEQNGIKKILPKKDEMFNLIEKQLLIYLDNDKDNENMLNKFGGQDDSIIDELIQYLAPKIEKIYLETRDYLINQQTIQLEQKLSSELNVEDKLNDLYTQVVIHNKSMDILHRLRKEHLEKELITPIEKHIIKTKCTIMNLQFIKEYNTLLCMASEEQQAQFVELNREIKLLMKQLNQKVELDKTREEEVKEMNTLVESLNSNSTTLQSFITQFETTAKQFSIFIKILDKKREKTYLKEKRQELKLNHTEHLAKLTDDTLQSGAVIFGTRLISICQYLLMLNDKAIYLFVPGKLVNPLLKYYLEDVQVVDEYCKGQIGEAFKTTIIPTLNKCQQMVVEYLVQNKKKKQTTESEQQDEENHSPSSSSISKEKELVELFTSIEKIIFSSVSSSE
ncbi:hypothetical protein C9374_004565 [Naegleria lovaniensis]|uniref:E3 UFM1-protein ligase 1-like N-terminal domain-containing protein n=1 Tax=Naegleria lovaniensis TaxID=51637 RepID=A0AA88GRL9_NAELO|nr:uncharacterized protein C9374_004565 [Naegleria lovaniensis]KAG2383228.1 hypothetical protein C9374_004565 [Naegleria lovaniensis]